MVIDTSALAAIFFHEPERGAFLEAIIADQNRLISAATLLETGIVIEGRQGEAAGREFEPVRDQGKFANRSGRR